MSTLTRRISPISIQEAHGSEDERSCRTSKVEMERENSTVDEDRLLNVGQQREDGEKDNPRARIAERRAKTAVERRKTGDAGRGGSCGNDRDTQQRTIHTGDDNDKCRVASGRRVSAVEK